MIFPPLRKLRYAYMDKAKSIHHSGLAFDTAMHTFIDAKAEILHA